MQQTLSPYYQIPSTDLILHDGPRTTKKVIIWGSAMIVAQLAVAYASYKGEYERILSVGQYQSVEDMDHNRTTIAINRCLLSAGSNYLDNWNRLCAYYGLAEGCGLPQSDYNTLAQGLEKDNAMCKADHQYKPASSIGPAVDDSGHMNLLH